MADECDQIWEARVDCTGRSAHEVLLEDLTGALRFRRMAQGKLLSTLKMGLFSLLRERATGDAGRMFVRFGADAFRAVLTLHRESEAVDRKTVELSFRSEDVEEIRVDRPFSGRFFRRKGGAVSRPVVVLGGSTGGFAWSAQVASVLASRGHDALAVSYFDFRGAGGLPRRLEEIPIEYFKSAVDWLKGETRAEKVGILGISKGSEAALLTASLYPDDIKAVAAYVPSEYVFEGVYMGRQRNRSSWSHDRSPLPFLPYPAGTKMGLFMKDGELGRIHEEAIRAADDETRQRAAIPVERIRAPVLLVSAGMDATWPSARMSAGVAERLETAGTRATHLDYEKAGHCFVLPNLPPILDVADLDPLECGAANRDAWDQVSRFFGEYL